MANPQKTETFESQEEIAKLMGKLLIEIPQVIGIKRQSFFGAIEALVYSNETYSKKEKNSASYLNVSVKSLEKYSKSKVPNDWTFREFGKFRRTLEKAIANCIGLDISNSVGSEGGTVLIGDSLCCGTCVSEQDLYPATFIKGYSRKTAQEDWFKNKPFLMKKLFEYSEAARARHFSSLCEKNKFFQEQERDLLLTKQFFNKVNSSDHRQDGTGVWVPMDEYMALQNVLSRYDNLGRDVEKLLTKSQNMQFSPDLQLLSDSY